MIEQVRRSLGARILLLAALNLTLLVGIGLAASGVRLPRSLGEMVMQSAEPRLQDVARRIALDLERTPAASATSLLDRYGTEFRTRFILVTNDGRHVAGVPLTLPEPVVAALAGPPPGERRRPRDGGRPPFPGGPPDRLGPADDRTGLRMPQTPARLVSVRGGPKTWIVLRTPIRFADTIEIIPGSLIVVPYAGLNDPLLFPIRWLWWSLLALGVTGACWWPLLRGLTRDLGRMEVATGQISEGRFDIKPGIAREDEVGRLSASIERMAGRLGALVSGQKRFLGDTAHELRSPLGRMQVALEILDTRLGQPERAYVADLKEDVEALAHLTDELLMYAQGELRDRGQALGLVSLRPIVEKVVAKEGQGADITIDVSPGATVKADALLLERAIANVVRNAVKYAAQAGPIAIRSASDDGVTTITVTDHGPGVAAASLERLFDPFFREDAARNRKTGGTGLGLAIVRSVVEACGGTVSCSNRLPHGLEVKMRLLDR